MLIDIISIQIKARAHCLFYCQYSTILLFVSKRIMNSIIFIVFLFCITLAIANDDQPIVSRMDIKIVDSESRDIQSDEYPILIPKINDVLKQLNVEQMIHFELSQIKSGQLKIENNSDIRWMVTVEFIATALEHVLCRLEIFEQEVKRVTVITCDQGTYTIERDVPNKNAVQ